MSELDADVALLEGVCPGERVGESEVQVVPGPPVVWGEMARALYTKVNGALVSFAKVCIEPLQEVVNLVTPCLSCYTQELQQYVRPLGQLIYEGQQSLTRLLELGTPAILRVVPTLERVSRFAQWYQEEAEDRRDGLIKCYFGVRGLNANDQQELEDITVSFFRLPAPFYGYVAEVLWCEPWHEAEDPILFVRKKVLATLRQERTVGFSSRAQFDSLDEARFPSSKAQPKYVEIERALDAIGACRRVGLKGREVDAARLLWLQWKGVPRTKAHLFLECSPNYIEALWRSLARVRPKLCREYE